MEGSCIWIFQRREREERNPRDNRQLMRPEAIIRGNQMWRVHVVRKTCVWQWTFTQRTCCDNTLNIRRGTMGCCLQTVARRAAKSAKRGMLFGKRHGTTVKKACCVMAVHEISHPVATSHSLLLQASSQGQLPPLPRYALPSSRGRR